MRTLLAVLLLTALLAGCSDPGPGDGSSTTTTTTQEPTLAVQWVWVNRTLNVSGTNTGGSAVGQGFEAFPGNENCVLISRIYEAGLVSLLVTANGENPDTVGAWDLWADLPGASQANNSYVVTGRLPLTMDLPTLEVRSSQSQLYVSLETARSSPGSTAVDSPVSLSIRLGVMAPEALGVNDGVITCST
jgi:hypothetical protein